MATQNTGYQGYFILSEIKLSDGSSTGYKKPNLANNSPQALVPNAATITYNYPADVTPSGGANGDIWYNPVADQLFKKIAGVWTLLNDRVADSDYVAPVQNQTACPVPGLPVKNVLLYAQYGITITGLTNGTTTGIPSDLASVNVTPGNTLTDLHNGITAGSCQLSISGTPVIPDHVRVYVKAGGSIIFESPAITNTDPINLIINNDIPAGSNFEVGIETF